MTKYLMLLLLTIPNTVFCQKKSISFSNQIAFSLNGAGDLPGYKIDVGIEFSLFKNTDGILKVGVGENKGSNSLLLYYKEYQNDASISLTGAVNRNLKLLRWLNVQPEIGFILRNHKWTIITNDGYIAIGEHVVPAHSSAQWNDQSIGYHIQIPFVFKISKRTSIMLFGEYENDTFGYTFFSVGTGVKLRLR